VAEARARVIVEELRGGAGQGRAVLKEVAARTEGDRGPPATVGRPWGTRRTATRAEKILAMAWLAVGEDRGDVVDLLVAAVGPESHRS
jgi:hypothetical protein